MSAPSAYDGFLETLREWLRNERRLGVRHVPAGPAAPRSSPEVLRSVPIAGRNAAQRERPAPGDAVPYGSPLNATLQPSVPSPVDELPPMCAVELPPAAAARELERLDAEHVRGCRRCPLHAGRSRTVFGVGDPRAELVFVGEGPGADEDREGLPFVGRAGQLLTRMIAAMTLTRERVYICNVVKCRPPENRTPSEDEMTACRGFLFRQLGILRPKVIVALGRPAAQTLLATSTPIGKLRGRFHDFPPLAYADLGLPPARLMPTFHPAYLLRSPEEKGKAWSDLQQVMQFLGLPGSGG